MLSSTLALYRRFILRDLRFNYVRSCLTIFGIALGVAVLLAITLANDTALTKFKDTVDRVSGRANLELRSTSTPWMNEEYLSNIRWLWDSGIKFTPIIEDNVLFHDADGPLVQLIGMDMLADEVFKSYEEASDTQSAGKADVDVSVLEPKAALVGSKLAAAYNLKKGSKFKLLVNEAPQVFTVSRVLTNKGLGGAFSGNLVVMDIRTAQQALNSTGKITRVEIVAPESEIEQVSRHLKHDLPASIAVERPSQRGQQVEKMTRSFQYNLLALTFIALMVSMFLIYNTMTISVIRRRPQIGTLRALGCSKNKILSLFVAESFTFGIVGTSLGILVGIAFAQGALGAVAQTFQHFYFQTPVEHVNLNPVTISTAFLIGVTVTVAAALAPAFEAAGVAPAEATRRASYELKSTRNATKYAIFGLVFFVSAAIFSVQPALNGVSVFGFAASLSTICGAALIMPQLLKFVLPLIGTFAEKLFRSEGRIAARSLEGTLGRTSVSIASLMIGIAMMVSLAIMIGSFRQTVMVWIDQTLKADLWLQSAARAGGSRQARMDEGLLEVIRGVPGVKAVDGFAEHALEYKGDPATIAGADLDVVSKYGHLLFIDGRDARSIVGNLGPTDCIVTEAFAIRKNVHEGEVLQIPTATGTIPLTIKGIYYDYASDLGYIIIPRKHYENLFGEHTISSCAIFLEPSASSDDVRAQILKAVGNKIALNIRTTRELRAEALKIFDRTFAITYALHTIAIAVAILSVMNALFALTMESKREFGILRYIGASEKQLRRIVLVEAGILGAVGNTTGIVLGYFLSLLLIYVVNKQSFGWTVQFCLPTEFLLQSSVLVFITAVLAGLIPARLAARTLAPSVVRDE